MELKDLYIGGEKTCPRCKGNRYIRGQKNYFDNDSLPNYKHIAEGICFLCDGEGKAFYSNDGKVLKLVNGNDGKYVIEYDSKNGRKKRILKKYSFDKFNNLSNKKNVSKVNKIELLNNSNVKVVEYQKSDKSLIDLFFPSMYEVLWGDSSPIVDLIMQTYPSSRAIQVSNYYGDEGYSVNFLIYCDKNGKIIKPFYIHPPYEEYDDYKSYNAVIKLPDEYLMGFSGSYYEEEDMMLFSYYCKGDFISFKYYNVKKELKKLKDINVLEDAKVHNYVLKNSEQAIIPIIMFKGALELSEINI